MTNRREENVIRKQKGDKRDRLVDVEKKGDERENAKGENAFLGFFFVLFVFKVGISSLNFSCFSL